MTQLTPEQAAQISHYAQKWRDIAYCTDPIDRAKVTEIIHRAYSLIGKPVPPIVFCSSPLDYIQKVSAFNQNTQPPDYSKLSGALNGFFGEMFQSLGQLQQAADNLAQASETELNPKIQDLVDSSLTQRFPEVFGLNQEESFDELQEELTQTSQAFQQQLKEDFPEFELPELLGEGLNTDLQICNELFSSIPNQIGYDLSQDVRRSLGNWRDFIPNNLSSLINRALQPNSRNLAPGLFYNTINNISLTENYNCYDFCISVLNCECHQPRWQVSVDILENCGYVYPFENLCYVCDRPTKILLDGNELAHALEEPAIEYADGFQIFACHGTLMPERYKTVPTEQWLPQWYGEESNPQLRSALIQVLPSEQLEIDWLLSEQSINLRQQLFNKIGVERILAELQVEDVLNILPQAVQDTSGSSLWVAYVILKHQTEPKIQSVIQRWQATQRDFNTLRKMILIDCLERILAWYQQHVPTYQEAFLPGLTHEEIEAKVKDLPFKLPQEAYDLYQWRNGGDTELINFRECWFMSLDRALEDTSYLNEADQVSMRIKDHYPAYLFSILPGEKGSYAMPVSPKQTEVSSILDNYYSDSKIPTVFDSLTTMMMAISECYESGVFIYKAEYNLVHLEDWDKSDEIISKYKYD